MKRKDFHNDEFDKGTLIKLHVFKKYLKEWLPVFTKKKAPIWKNIYIYDFFAGEGTDGEGNPGSPLIILDELKSFCESIKAKGLKLKVVFNEFDKRKHSKLVQCTQEHLRKCRTSEVQNKNCPNYELTDNCVFHLLIENKDFNQFFKEIYNTMLRKPEYPRFMFLDQFGIKQISEEVFGKLVSLDRTDFIFFISSSHVSRFSELPEFKKYLNISRSEFDVSKPYHCHRVIYEYYKGLLPKDKEFYLAPFSIKKGRNIYGLIFGSHHKLGIEKFLKVCWGINPNTGDANFDIDGERIASSEPKLFAEFNVPNKLQLFERELVNKILDSELKTNIDLYTFTFDMGCLPKHSNSVVNKLIKENKIRALELALKNIHKLRKEQIELIRDESN